MLILLTGKQGVLDNLYLYVKQTKRGEKTPFWMSNIHEKLPLFKMFDFLFIVNSCIHYSFIYQNLVAHIPFFRYWRDDSEYGSGL